jgi:hypothetical protein
MIAGEIVVCLEQTLGGQWAHNPENEFFRTGEDYQEASEAYYAVLALTPDNSSI